MVIRKTCLVLISAGVLMTVFGFGVDWAAEILRILVDVHVPGAAENKEVE